MSKLASALAVGVFAVGCATAPTTPAGRRDLRQQADNTIQQMTTRDPGLAQVLDRAVGYAVFPEIGKGGVLVGGAWGRGVVYEAGEQVGYVELNQASIGAQLGGQTFSELIVFMEDDALQDLKDGEFNIGVNASAVVLKAGAAAAANVGDQGVLVFVLPAGGLMVELTISGQQINYQPRG